jgi:hypothetical protein
MTVSLNYPLPVKLATCANNPSNGVADRGRNLKMMRHTAMLQLVFPTVYSGAASGSASRARWCCRQCSALLLAAVAGAANGGRLVTNPAENQVGLWEAN